MKKISSFGIALAVLTVVLAGCTQSSAPATQTDTTQSTTPTSAAMTSASAMPAASAAAQSSGSAMMSDVKEIAVDSFSFGFTPSTIRVKAGEKVRLNVTNKGGFHNFEIPEYYVETQTPDGKTTVVEFTAGKAGTYEFFCGVGNHKAQGQKGTLIVE